MKLSLSTSWRHVGESLLIMKANEKHYFSDLFDKILYMFWTRPPSTIRSISTLYTQYVFVMLVLLASASVVRMDHANRRQQN